MRRIPQHRSLLWCLFHPFKARKIREENRVILNELKDAALRVTIEIDRSPIVRQMSNEQALTYIQKKLQEEFFKVLIAHQITAPEGPKQEESIP